MILGVGPLLHQRLAVRSPGLGRERSGARAQGERLKSVSETRWGEEAGVGMLLGSRDAEMAFRSGEDYEVSAGVNVFSSGVHSCEVAGLRLRRGRGRAACPSQPEPADTCPEE
jgi:hypothetical protein